jgi:hypothetical protein
MVMMSAIKAFAASLALLLAACSTMPIPAGTDTAWQGNLKDGGKFGATVGQSMSDVQQVLVAQGYAFEGMAACSSTTRDLFACGPSDQYAAFQPLAMDRKGHIYLKTDGDRVSQIGWDLKVVAYLDN